jgi:hypothetical protein
VDRRCFTAGHNLVAVRTGFNFVQITQILKHRTAPSKGLKPSIIRSMAFSVTDSIENITLHNTTEQELHAVL